MFNRKPKRYVARNLNWRPILGVDTGVVDDTMPEKPKNLPEEMLEGEGFKWVTTYHHAKQIARRANRLERKG